MLADVGMVLWVVLWVQGRRSGSTTRRWPSPSRAATSPAPGVELPRDTMASAGDNVDDLPLLEDRVATPFRSAAGVGIGDRARR